MSDSELVKSYLSGKEQALEVLISRHQQRVFTYIVVRIQDEDIANDIFQDTFVKVINTLKRGKYNEEGKFLQWTLRIAHNLVIDHFRREKRMPTMSPTDDFNIFNILTDGSLNVDSTMIKDQKEVLKLRHFSGLSFKEIAEQTDVSINTALGRMRYALINLRKLMAQHGVSLLMQ